MGIKAAPLWWEEWGRLVSPFKSQRYEQAAAAVPGTGHARPPAQPEMALGWPTPGADSSIPKTGSQQHRLAQGWWAEEQEVGLPRASQAGRESGRVPQASPVMEM